MAAVTWRHLSIAHLEAAGSESKSLNYHYH
jgi:hypothetical protein